VAAALSLAACSTSGGEAADTITLYRQIRVWSCDGHREGLEDPESVGHR
jgi:hypothetical protein